jgi:F0F1-type ATP synthase membrane subunit b/b'
LVFASCGGKSDAEQARTDACNADADIGKQIKQLKGYTETTVTSEKVRGNVNAIKSDVNTIKSALPELKASLKSQLKNATDTFSSQLSKVASGLGSTISLQAAAGQITTAANQLDKSYTKAFASVSC